MGERVGVRARVAKDGRCCDPVNSIRRVGPRAVRNDGRRPAQARLFCHCVRVQVCGGCSLAREIFWTCACPQWPSRRGPILCGRARNHAFRGTSGWGSESTRSACPRDVRSPLNSVENRRHYALYASSRWKGRASLLCPTVYMSTCSAIASASSSSIPRVTDSAFDLGMAKQKLNCSELASAPVD